MTACQLLDFDRTGTALSLISRPEKTLSDAIDIGTAIESQSRTPFSRLILVLCCAAMMIEGYDNQVLAYAAPAIIRDWNIEKALFGPVFGAALFVAICWGQRCSAA
jgi:hypothetical protein